MSDKPTLEELRATLRNLFGDYPPMGCQGNGCTGETEASRRFGIFCPDYKEKAKTKKPGRKNLDLKDDPLKVAAEIYRLKS